MKRFSKLLSIVLLGTSLMAVTPLEANAAWEKDNNGWWYTEGNSYVKNSWRKINGSWYYFDNSGYMKTGWLKNGGEWYYLNSNGTRATGWVKDGSKWYYMNNYGVMQTGWIEENYEYYYLDNNGVMKTGWMKVDNEWHYGQANGTMKMGWFFDHGNWYYLAPYSKGKMEKDIWMYDGYHLNSQGVWDDSTKYHLDDFMYGGYVTCESGKKLGLAGSPGPVSLINNEPIRFCMGGIGDENHYYVGLNTLNVYDEDGQIIDKATLVK